MGQFYSRCIAPLFGAAEDASDRRADAYKVDGDAADGVVVVEPPKYSWDTRAEGVDPKNFIFDGLDGIVTGKLPGSIQGQQFVIQNCKNSTLYLYDHSATVTIDDCENCKIFVGPCKGSVCIRDTKSCCFAISCQQFRTRDCDDLDVFLFCATQPIIEESKNIRFACLQLNYPNFDAQLEAAQLQVFNNTWSKIHDFTPSHGNCSCLPETDNLTRYIPFENEQSFTGPPVEADSETSLIPLTLGLRPAPSKQVVFLLCFCGADGVQGLRQRCMTLIRAIQRDESARLVLAKEVMADAVGIERILGNADAYKGAVLNGPVIGLEWNGEAAASRLAVWLDAQPPASLQCHLCAEQPDAKQQLAKFYSFADMKHSV